MCLCDMFLWFCVFSPTSGLALSMEIINQSIKRSDSLIKTEKSEKKYWADCYETWYKHSFINKPKKQINILFTLEHFTNSRSALKITHRNSKKSL